MKSSAPRWSQDLNPFCAVALTPLTSLGGKEHSPFYGWGI